MFADGLDLRTSDGHIIMKEGEQINHPKDVLIGDRVWIGKDVAVLKGVEIGSGAVVGIRSIVTKDIESGTVNVGIPAKKIRDGVYWKR